jgi:prepilin-type processing-associated H-X9-DG protein
MLLKNVTRLVAAAAVVVGTGRIAERAAAQGEGPTDALVIHSAGFDRALSAEKDRGLAAALAMIDARLLELPREIAGAPPEVWPAVNLAWDILRRPMTLRLTVDAEVESGPPFAVSLSVDAGGAAKAGEMVGRVTGMIDAAGLPSDEIEGGRRFLTPPGPIVVRSEGDRMLMGLNARSWDATPPAVGGLPRGVDPVGAMKIDLAAARPLIEMAMMMGSPNAAETRMMLETFGILGEHPWSFEAAWGHAREHAEIVARVHDMRGRGGMFAMPEGVTIGERMLRMIPADATVAQAGVFSVGFVDELITIAERETGEDIYASFEEEFGFHLKRDLLDHVGNRAAFYQSEQTGGGGIMSGVLMVELGDPAAFLETHARIVEMINLVGSLEAGGYVRIRLWEAPGGRAYCLSTPGLPLPIELSWAVVGNHAVAAASPVALGQAIRLMSQKGPGFLANASLREMAGDDPGSLVTLDYFDARRFAPKGYAFVSLAMAALSNAVRSPHDEARQPPMVMPAFGDFVDGVRPAMTVGRWEGDDLVFHGRADRSMLVNGAAVVGQMGGWMGIQAAAMGVGVLMPAMASARESAKQLQSATHVRMIGTAMIAHATEHGDRYPDGLETLLEAGFLDHKTLSSPFGPAWDGGPDFLIDAGGVTAHEPDRIIVIDRAMWVNSEDAINVGFADGHAEMLRSEELDRRLEEPRHAWLKRALLEH